MDRLEALQAREKQYDSVEPCGKCGFKRRYTRNRRCVNCWIEALQKNAGPRKSARASGAKTYFTGKPCSNGHIAPRYTKSGACKECVHPIREPKAREPKERKLTLRQVARLTGLTTYFTGKPCSNGHIAPRYTSTGSCTHCVNPPKATRSVRVPNVHPSDIPALLAYATALSLSRLS